MELVSVNETKKTGIKLHETVDSGDEKYEKREYEKREYGKKPFKKNGGGGGGRGGFKPKPVPKSAVDGFIGREIIIKMRDGKFETGKLENIYQYEFVIIGGDGLPIIILKHAVDSIKLKVS